MMSKDLFPTQETASKASGIATRLRQCTTVFAGALFVASVGSTLAASRISEPNTVLYGRIVERVGEYEFPMTTGQLVWNLRTTGANGREYRLTANLEPLGEGRFSYRLSIPHEVLAYDLTVNPKAVGLTSAGSTVQHLSITVDGTPLTITPVGMAASTQTPLHRASAVRVDLALSVASPDSDGDGLPDWWEDLNGLDKYDSSDASRFLQGQDSASDAARISAAARAQTFAEWRAVWFPGNTTDLEAFGQDDPDKDGISNLLEYAFGLNPTAVDPHSGSALPHAVSVQGRSGVSFLKRAGSTDLEYSIETSEDLFQWQDGSSGQLQEVTSASLNGENPGMFLERQDSSNSSHRFFRVRVRRH